jgi:hypothetical protein
MSFVEAETPNPFNVIDDAESGVASKIVSIAAHHVFSEKPNSKDTDSLILRRSRGEP